MLKCLATIAIGTGLLWSGPVLAQSLPEPAQEAVPLNSAQLQRAVTRQLPATQRFHGLPEMRFGFLVDASGSVRSCLALPVAEDEPARGQKLCDGFIEDARFRPAVDEQGNAIDSVFIARFEETRPVVAADFAGVPVN